MGERRVALISRAAGYVGPALARSLAGAGHDLVLQAAVPGQVDELRALGVDVEVVEPAVDDRTAEGCSQLVARALDRFGRLDAAALFPPAIGATGFARGPFLHADVDALRSMAGYLETTFHALRAVIPAMASGGQVLVFTSDAGARPEAGWTLYGAARAGQSFLVRAVALEHAPDGICINALGSKNAVFAGFPGADAGDITDSEITLGDWAEPLVAETPLGRLGTMEELAAFATTLLDGRNRFQTAQYFSYSGGWDAL